MSVAAVPATLCGVGPDALGDRHHPQPSVVHGCDHGAGRLGGKRDPVRHVRGACPADPRRRRCGAAVEGGRSRLRPILMTSCAMIAGMLPMAIGLSAGGDQVAPLGRAVVGGLAASTLATLLILPAVFAVVQRRAGIVGASMDPDDPNSGALRRWRSEAVQRVSEVCSGKWAVGREDRALSSLPTAHFPLHTHFTTSRLSRSVITRR